MVSIGSRGCLAYCWWIAILLMNCNRQVTCINGNAPSLNLSVSFSGICELCQGPKWWRPHKGLVVAQKPDCCRYGSSDFLFARWEGERKLCVSTIPWKKGVVVIPSRRDCYPFCSMGELSQERRQWICRGRKLTELSTGNHSKQCNSMQWKQYSITEAVPLGDVALYCSLVKDLNLAVLAL